MPAWQVPRTCSGWMQLYKELAHYNVQAVPWFKAAHQCFLLMWIQPPAASPLRFDSIEGRGDTVSETLKLTPKYLKHLQSPCVRHLLLRP